MGTSRERLRGRGFWGYFKMKVERMMSNFNSLPKTVKKTVRYIYQDAPVDKLMDIQKIINEVIEKRLQEKQS